MALKNVYEAPEIYDSPIFRLRQLDLRRGRLSATFSTDSFLHYRLSAGADLS